MLASRPFHNLGLALRPLDSVVKVIHSVVHILCGQSIRLDESANRDHILVHPGVATGQGRERAGA